MFFTNEESFNRPAEKRAETALMWLHMFNASEIDETSGAMQFSLSIYDLGHAFFEIRTMMAKRPESVPHEWLLRREVALARRNVLTRFPRLLASHLVNNGFDALEGLLDHSTMVESRRAPWNVTKALAVSHVLQNILHNIHNMHMFGLFDFDRALGNQLPINVQTQAPKYLH